MPTARQIDRPARDRFQRPQTLYNNEHRLLEWTKRIDDALRENVRLRILTVPKWDATLRNELLEEVNKFWREIGFKP
jgi:hypothetical protein